MRIFSFFITFITVLSVEALSIPSGMERREVPAVEDVRELTKRIDIVAKTDEILYKYTIDQFLTAKAQRNPPELVWDKIDGCSGLLTPNGVPSLYNFRPSCERHDFGFANYRKQNRLCRGSRNALDQQFKKDMNDHCSKRFGRWYEYFQRRACRAAAEAYYLGVAYGYDPSYSQGCQ